MIKIMIVDDEPDTLELYQKRLETPTREITTFQCPKKALEALDNEDWDVLITDIMMPELDGFSLIKKAAKLPKRLPCIAVTGYGSDDTLRKALETDCFGYLNKPFDWNYLNLLVDKAIRSSTRLRRQPVWSRNNQDNKDPK